MSQVHCVLMFSLSQVVNVTRNGDINFCKAFWQINESSVMHVSAYSNRILSGIEKCHSYIIM